MQRLKLPALIFILFFITAVSVTFPAIVHLNDLAIGITTHPGFQGEMFFERAIMYGMQKGDLGHWFTTDLVFYPRGQNIGPRVANSLHLFFSLPLNALFGPVASYNILALITLALNGLTMYILARYFFPSRLISFCAGLFFMLNSYVLLKINMGFLHKVNLFWLPLYFLCLFRLRDEKKNIYLAGSVFFLCLVKLAYPPYAYYAGLFTAALVSYDVIHTGGNLYFLKRVFLLFALFLAVIFILDFMNAGFRFFSTQYVSFQKEPPPLFPHGQIDILHPFKSILPYPTGLPLGVSLLGGLLGIYAAFRKKGLPGFFLIVVILSLVISAGPYLVINGKPLVISGYKLVLPYYLLYKLTPAIYGEALILPIRIFSIVNIFLALLIGYALTLIAQKIAKKGTIVVAISFMLLYSLENLILFPELLPVRVTKPDIPEFYRQIRDEKFKAILNLPISSVRRITNLYCYYAAMADKKIMNAYDSDRLCIDIPDGLDAIDIKRRFIQQLNKWDVRYIVIHRGLCEEVRDGISPNDWEWLAYLCGRPMNYENDGLIVYRIPENER